jgi:hypothetical protein
MRRRGGNDDTPHATRLEQATYGVYDEWNPIDRNQRLGAATTESFASPRGRDERDGGRVDSVVAQLG